VCRLLRRARERVYLDGQRVAIEDVRYIDGTPGALTEDISEQLDTRLFRVSPVIMGDECSTRTESPKMSLKSTTAGVPSVVPEPATTYTVSYGPIARIDPVGTSD
jgi:hypothetical protein